MNNEDKPISPTLGAKPTATTEASVETAAVPSKQDLVDEWIRERVRNSPISANTEAYNHLMKYLPELVAKI